MGVSIKQKWGLRRSYSDNFRPHRPGYQNDARMKDGMVRTRLCAKGEGIRHEDVMSTTWRRSLLTRTGTLSTDASFFPELEQFVWMVTARQKNLSVSEVRTCTTLTLSCTSSKLQSRTVPQFL
jgi:hypothetical protein